MQNNQLSKADARVLACVFDPEGSQGAEVIVDADLPADSQIQNDGLLRALKIRERAAVSMIEKNEQSKDGPDLKDVAYREALEILDGIIAEYPTYASARNNRAQLRRWRYGDRNTICQPASGSLKERSSAGEAIVQDLRYAIDLASPRRPQDAVSPAQGRLLAQAYTQLGAMFYAASKDLGSNAVMHISVASSTEWTRDRMEEESSRLFYLGGLYGNEVAKALAVHTNPHAKLCGSIVREAMRKELAGVEV